MAKAFECVSSRAKGHIQLGWPQVLTLASIPYEYSNFVLFNFPLLNCFWEFSNGIIINSKTFNKAYGLHVCLSESLSLVSFHKSLLSASLLSHNGSLSCFVSVPHVCLDQNLCIYRGFFFLPENSPLPSSTSYPAKLKLLNCSLNS